MKNQPTTTHMTVREVARLKQRTAFSLTELLLVLGVIGLLIALLLPATRRGAGEAARRTQCKNNLKQIALALHNYADYYGGFPPANMVDAEGRPLHSWRTLILPYLEQQALYESIDLSKPWDDPANAAALATTLAVYQCPSVEIPPNHTTYVGLVGADNCLHPTQPRTFSEITDGTASTLMVIEVSPEGAIPWMSPQDGGTDFVLSFGAETEFDHEGGTQAALADGSVRFLSAELPIDARRVLTSIAGNDDPGEW